VKDRNRNAAGIRCCISSDFLSRPRHFCVTENQQRIGKRSIKKQHRFDAELLNGFLTKIAGICRRIGAFFMPEKYGIDAVSIHILCLYQMRVYCWLNAGSMNAFT
jgi:hypothetical protein